MMNRPEILMADEPTADLDSQTELEVMGILREVNRIGVTVLMITHNLDLVPYASRAFKLEKGELTALNTDEYRNMQTREAPSRMGLEENAPELTAVGASCAPVNKQSSPAPGGRLNSKAWPASIGYTSLVVALLVMTVAFGLTLGKVLAASPSTQANTPPVITTTVQNGSMGMDLALGAGTTIPNTSIPNGMYGMNGANGMSGMSGGCCMMGGMSGSSMSGTTMMSGYTTTVGQGMYGSGMYGYNGSQSAATPAAEPPAGEPLQDPSSTGTS
jgi:energy-coupling factor transporter ATP-binding protein EcfA2